eukprot:485108_1
MLLLLISTYLVIYHSYAQSTNYTFSFANTQGDYMVLQQAPWRAKVWGTSPTVGASITIQLSLQDGSKTIQTVSVIADSNGIWSTYFNPITTSTVEYMINATMSGKTISLQHILFGDVFVCSGQSNMRFAVSQAFNATQEIQDANNYPHIRVFTAAETGSLTPAIELLKVEEKWSIASNVSIGGEPWSYFSAICWFFGKYMYNYLNYPVGLIATDYCGTPVRYWSSPDALAKCNETYTKVAEKYKDVHYVQTMSDRYGSDPLASGHHVPADMLQLSDSSLFNAMIYPFLQTTIRAAIWYQGEADSNVQYAAGYACQFPAMISDWRQKWSLNSDTSPDFPFGFVQLSTWDDATLNVTCGNDYGCTVAAVVRYGSTGNFGFVPNTLMPNTFMATAIDLGDPTSPWNGDVHPRYKQQVAERLTNAGKAVIYSESEVYWTGPVADKAFMSDGNVIVNFRNVGEQGLLIKHSLGFEVYDTVKSLWITINKTVVSSGDYNITLSGLNSNANISQVRYNWFKAPCQPDLGIYNCAIYDAQYSLPATPFIVSVLKSEY